MMVVQRGDLKIHSSLLIATVDEAKGKPRGYARIAHDGPQIKPFVFNHNREGYDMFVQRITEFGNARAAQRLSWDSSRPVFTVRR